jgi:hypothetical protein
LAEARLVGREDHYGSESGLVRARTTDARSRPTPAPFTRFAVVCSPLECECSAPPYRSAASHYFHRVFLAARTTQIATDP